MPSAQASDAGALVVAAWSATLRASAPGPRETGAHRPQRRWQPTSWAISRDASGASEGASKIRGVARALSTLTRSLQ